MVMEAPYHILTALLNSQSIEQPSDDQKMRIVSNGTNQMTINWLIGSDREFKVSAIQAFIMQYSNWLIN